MDGIEDYGSQWAGKGDKAQIGGQSLGKGLLMGTMSICDSVYRSQ